MAQTIIRVLLLSGMVSGLWWGMWTTTGTHGDQDCRKHRKILEQHVAEVCIEAAQGVMADRKQAQSLDRKVEPRPATP